MIVQTTIFLSHISEEAELANIFKTEIESRFLGMVNVFVSSDANTITLGRKWLDDVTEGLRNCSAMLLFCSSYSVKRPWINFECGAGWARGIDVAPICHSGLRPVDLPIPISLLQGLEASDPKRIKEVFSLIAGKLNSQVPIFDLIEFIGKITDFEKGYTIKNEITLNLHEINKASPDIFKMIPNFIPKKINTIQGIPEILFNKIQKSLESLQSNNHLSFNWGINGIGLVAAGQSGGGNFGTLTLSVEEKIIDLAKVICSL